MIARPDIDAALRRLLVDCERPAELRKWTPPYAKTVHHGAVRVQDKYGRDVSRVA
jgi:hypothetical protein